MSKIYTTREKKKLAEKIERIKDEKNIKKITEIIFTNNPNIKVSKNSAGILLKFNELENKTYHLLDKYIVKIQQQKISDFVANTETTSNNKCSHDIDIYTHRYKLSNKEKNIIRKKRYEEELTDDIIYNSDSDIESIFTKMPNKN